MRGFGFIVGLFSLTCLAGCWRWMGVLGGQGLLLLP